MKKALAIILVLMLGLSLLVGCGGDKSPYAGVKVGDIVQLGGYDWQVLAIKDNKALVLSDKCLEEKPYHRYRQNVTWEVSDMRRYLNGSFFENTFTEEEKMWITESTIVTGDHYDSGTPGGNDTIDRVFLLSVEEVKEYFPDEKTRLAEEIDTGQTRSWLLRSPGRENNWNSTVDREHGNFTGGYAENHGPYIRPAMWLSTKNAVAQAESKPEPESAVTERYTLFDMTEGGKTYNAVQLLESGRNPNEAYLEFMADGTFTEVRWSDLSTGGTYERSASGSYKLTYDNGEKISPASSGNNISIHHGGNAYMYRLDNYN